MKLRKTLALLSFGMLCLTVQAQQAPARPKLVVGLMVDQMRWDYLYRYAERYGNGGFKRLLKEGFTCQNTYINYVPTYTAIGHSTVYTGSVPSIHGITGNDWVTQRSGESMYCTQDDNVVGVGTSSKEGKQSPRNLLTSTVTDQLRLATNFKAKVIGIAMKDRGAILPAGHFGNAAYWFEGKTGNWITSNFYMEKLPKWVEDFNKKKLAEKYLKQDWHTLYDIATYTASMADDNEYEGKITGEAKPVFPHLTSKLMKDGDYDLIKTTPYGNQLTLDMAKAAIEAEKLGNNPSNNTDFLCVSLSSPDYIGHRYSVMAVEVEDTYLRLDQQLEDFFNYLDKTVGEGNYTFFLTADHGVAYNARYFMDQKGNAGYFQNNQVMRNLDDALMAKFGASKLVKSLANYQVHLDYAALAKANLDEDKVKAEIIKVLKKEEGIAYVVDIESGDNMAIPALIRERIINGYNRQRSGAIQMILEPQWYTGSPRAVGTTHGTWSPYDSHIPLVFMGWGIKPGVSNQVTNMTDIAPTISALLHITEPNGNIGKPIVEVIRN